MCGRFYVDSETARGIERVIQDVRRQLHVPVSGDVHPSEHALVIAGEGAGLCAKTMSWGFEPYQGNGLIINARAESVLQKPMFSGSVLQRRCAIPAGHFYEWNRMKEKAVFKRDRSSIMYMAGVYQRFQDEERFVILTTAANDSVRPVHDRMPVILEEEELSKWIFDEIYMRHVLTRVPVRLERKQEFEQLSFIEP